MTRTAIVWIRRSMREYDNRALVEASKDFDEVIPFYVVDEDYFQRNDLGYPRVKFWSESLKYLKNEILTGNEDKDLIIRKGRPLTELRKIIKETEADKLFFNRDYSPYSRERDQKVKETVKIPVETFKDIVMFEKKEILTSSDTPYKVFTYYGKKWKKKNKPRPEEPEEYTVPDNINSKLTPEPEDLGFEKPEDMEVWKGGRKQGLKNLKQFKNRVINYEARRDYPADDMTSKLSPHLKFGTVSIREVFWESERIRARTDNEEGIDTWQEELAWREFYFQLLWNFPESTQEALQEKYRGIEYHWDERHEKLWNAFLQGKTGFPFVDAGMRQLKKTGWMHNRLRMVVTSFAAKDLHVDWHKLHDYFNKMFVDAELAAMIGGIQWAYSIGTDAQPYFRVFNPFSQGEKYDPEGEYIKKYVPELRKVPKEHIHKPHEMPQSVQIEAGCIIGEDYPEPIVDHREEREKAIEMFEDSIK